MNYPESVKNSNAAQRAYDAEMREAVTPIPHQATVPGFTEDEWAELQWLVKHFQRSAPEYLDNPDNVALRSAVAKVLG